MKLYVKYMVSIRCKMILKSELERMGIRYKTVDLGVADIEDQINEGQRKELKNELMKSGLELMDDKKAILVEKVKTLVIEMIHYDDELPTVKKSIYISEKLNYDYTYLANLFSEVTGITIEQYIIAHKIEKIKGLILYGELTLTQIAYKMHYSSLAHLSNQFKKVTGLTPTYFKQLKNKKLNTLENVGKM
jgi:AraC-like DNA-binding protein